MSNGYFDPDAVDETPNPNAEDEAYDRYRADKDWEARHGHSSHMPSFDGNLSLREHWERNRRLRALREVGAGRDRSRPAPNAA